MQQIFCNILSFVDEICKKKETKNQLHTYIWSVFFLLAIILKQKIEREGKKYSIRMRNVFIFAYSFVYLYEQVYCP